MQGRWRTGLGLFWLLAGLTIACPGCQPKDGGSQFDLFAKRRPTSDIWQPQPVRMRVYPASRFAGEAGHIVLEARIEMLDVMDDPIKAAGRFHFDLLDADKKNQSRLDRKLYSWDVPLLTLAEQKDHYDSVTRTYLFRLRMDEQFVPRNDTVLKVTYMPVVGAALEVQGVMEGAS